MNHGSVVYLGNIPAVAEALCSQANLEFLGCLIEKEDVTEEMLNSVRRYGYLLYPLNSRSDLLPALRMLQPIDLGILANFGWILTQDELKTAAKGFVNAHLGLLPDYPGRDPITQALQKGELVVGVSLHRAIEEPDTGSLIDRRLVSAGVGRNPRQTFDRLCGLIPELLLKNLPKILV